MARETKPQEDVQGGEGGTVFNIGGELGLIPPYPRGGGRWKEGELVKIWPHITTVSFVSAFIIVNCVSLSLLFSQVCFF